MKKYKTPNIVIEEFSIEDTILTSSSFKINDVNNIGDGNHIFDEDF